WADKREALVGAGTARNWQGDAAPVDSSAWSSSSSSVASLVSSFVPPTTEHQGPGHARAFAPPRRNRWGRSSARTIAAHLDARTSAEVSIEVDFSFAINVTRTSAPRRPRARRVMLAGHNAPPPGSRGIEVAARTARFSDGAAGAAPAVRAVTSIP